MYPGRAMFAPFRKASARHASIARRVRSPDNWWGRKSNPGAYSTGAIRGIMIANVQASAFDERAFFHAISRSGARALLIGRRALIALGLPVMTRDYDYWLHREDAALFNDAPLVTVMVTGGRAGS